MASSKVTLARSVLSNEDPNHDGTVSPPAEHISGPQWWTDYQPVSYILTSKRGNRAQFSNMINECHTAGVMVIAGAVFNPDDYLPLIIGHVRLDTLFNHMVYPFSMRLACTILIPIHGVQAGIDSGMFAHRF
jgi:hypothetical protein